MHHRNYTKVIPCQITRWLFYHRIEFCSTDYTYIKYGQSLYYGQLFWFEIYGKVTGGIFDVAVGPFSLAQGFSISKCFKLFTVGLLIDYVCMLAV